MRGSQFLFLQGHPEYAPDSLFREYRRDVRRYITGQSVIYPELPENYFDRKTARDLTKLRGQAERWPSPRLLASIYAIFAAAAIPACETPAARLYSNWLGHLAQEKARREGETHRSHSKHNAAPHEREWAFSPRPRSVATGARP